MSLEDSEYRNNTFHQAGQSPRLIACLLYPNVMSLDVCGPLQVFASANAELKQRHCAKGYELRLLSAIQHQERQHASSAHEDDDDSFNAIASSAGIKFMADRSYQHQVPAEMDTLLIPGGFGVDQQLENDDLIHWIIMAEPQVRRLGSVCSGALLLAKTGLLDGRMATTHWQRVDELSRQYPNINVQGNRLHTYDPLNQEGDAHVFTSAGVTAGIDLALALIEEDYDRSLALSVARRLVMFLKRSGGQNQFSELLIPNISHARLSHLLEWIGNHLSDDLSLEAIAQQVNMTPRSLSRLFVRELGVSPGRYIERLRIETARALLEEGQISMTTAAKLTGFRHPDSLRRLFHKHFDVSPSEYRQRFV